MTDNRDERLKRLAADLFAIKMRGGSRCWMDADDDRQPYIEQFIERYKDCDLDELERNVVAARPPPGEPDYTLTIIEQDGGFVVYEAGKPVSKPFAERVKAKWWLKDFRAWYQPSCIVCRSGITRADDPWEVIQSGRADADWAHRSCWKKFDYWARTIDEKTLGPGVHQIPPIELLDAVWSKRQATDP
jgi:hypothetical protein